MAEPEPTVNPLGIDELLGHVFSFLAISDRLSCSHVSKRWCRLVHKIPLPETVVVRANTALEVIHKGGTRWSIVVRALEFESITKTASEKAERLSAVLSAFPNVRNLSASYIDGAVGLYYEDDLRFDLSPVRASPRLQAIHCRYPMEVVGVSALAELNELRVFEFTTASAHRWQGLAWEEAQHLSRCTGLERLELFLASNAHPGQRLTALSTLTRLSSLSTRGYDLPSDLSVWPLTELSVRFLWGPGADFPASVEPIAPRLRALVITSTPYDCAAATVGMCTELTSLEVSFAPRHFGAPPAATNISFLSGCTKLKHLVLAMAPAVTDISALKNCTQITTLGLDRFRALKDFSPLAHCPLLHWFQLYNSPYDPTLSTLSTCTNIQRLRLFCVSMSWPPLSSCEISWMCSLPNLRFVGLEGNMSFGFDGVERVKEHVLGHRGTVVDRYKKTYADMVRKNVTTMGNTYSARQNQ